MKKVCVRDGKRSRMISAIFLDKIFAIIQLKIDIMSKIVKELNCDYLTS